MPLSGSSGGRHGATVVPGHSSVRLQKAYRLNGVEGIRLQWRLQILNRQKVRAVRLVNQDIRLTRIALEHIHISSGISVSFDDINDDVSDRGSGSHVDGPMFLYGERQVSRKQGRSRRAQSAAADEAGSRRSAPTGDDADAATKRPLTALPATTEAMVFDVVRARAEAHFSVEPPPPPQLAAPVDIIAAIAPSRGQPLPPPPPSGVAKSNLGNFYALTPLALGRTLASSTAVDGRAQTAGGETAGPSKPAVARAAAVSADAASRSKRPAASGAPRPATVDAAAASSAAVVTSATARSRRQTSEADSSAAAADPAVTSLAKAAATAKTVTVEARAARAAMATMAFVTTAASEKKASPRSAAAAATSADGVDAALARSNNAAAMAIEPLPVSVASRSQRTAEAVQKARAQSGRAKRFRNSIVGDPLLDQTLPMAEKKRKQKEATLQHRKNVQRTADESVAEKVRDYLIKHPLLGGGRSDAPAGGGDDSDVDGDDDVFEKAPSVAKEAAVGITARLRQSRSIAWAT